MLPLTLDTMDTVKVNGLTNTLFLQAIMDREKKNELPKMQVQFFDSVGIPVFRVSLVA